MMNDLDELMSRPVLDLTSQDIDDIILYHRRQRARKIAGEKPKKPVVDLTSLIVVPRATPATTIKRRF